MNTLAGMLQELSEEQKKPGLAVAALEDLAEPVGVIKTSKPRTGKRVFTAAAREKMRLAQKKRWAKWHREQGAKHRG